MSKSKVMKSQRIHSLKNAAKPKVRENRRGIAAAPITKSKAFKWAVGIGVETFSIESVASGGMGTHAMFLLKEAGIPCRQCYTPYQGHIGIAVPAEYAKRAEDIIL